MTTKSPEEMDELRAQGASAVKAYCDAELKNVFGFDVIFDAEGRPVERGIGSALQPTANHFAAMRKREVEGQEEPGTTDRALAEAWLKTPELAKKLGLPRPKAVSKHEKAA